MIVYFADRNLNILGQASTNLPKGLLITEDLKTEDVETGVSIFECKIPFDNSTRQKAETWAAVGNYILRSHDNENEFYTIIDAEIDTKKQTVYIYAEDDGMDLINEVAGAYEAADSYPISHYINKYAEGSGWEIGVNEVEGLTRKLSLTDEVTTSQRLLDIAAAFNDCDISYSFEVKNLNISKKYINIYEKRGKDTGIQLRLNREVDSIVTTKTISNLATALQCTGGTPDDAENPITLLGYAYDDGDFYVDGTVLKSRKALANWSRYLWRDDETKQAGGHIVKQFSYDTLSQEALCVNAIAELKEICDAEVNYDVDISNFPENVSIGDRVNIVDDKGELYLSSRVLTLETSIADQTRRAVLGEHLIRKSGISAKVERLAAEFSKQTVSVARAKTIAANAQKAAEAAQAQANAAAKDAATAQTKANEAATAANVAAQSAQAAQMAAGSAQAAVETVQNNVAGIEKTVSDAQAAAEQARQAAETAATKATEAQQAAVNAQNDAKESKKTAETAQSKSEEAVQKSEEAKTTAAQAVDEAEKAATTAAAAKLDADNARKDINSLGERLATVSNTMEADYARKTDLTEAEASLQSQITQNAAEIGSTASKVQLIDETTNDAQKILLGAIAQANLAQEQADKATEDAEAAQAAADEAEQAAIDAQAEADTAQAAADEAKAVADKAEIDLAAAKADLETVQSRADATEAEIAAAQAAVDAAQSAADTALSEAKAAANIAAEAQQRAKTAVTNADKAVAAAALAVNDAAIAQAVADEAKGEATAAQQAAEIAQEAADVAQSSALEAKANADTAQATADSAAATAAESQYIANDARSIADDAVERLTAAQQALADVLAKVDATEEEVAAAQADVDSAQASAEQAQAEADAAQIAADEAAANAVIAKTAADEANTAAEEAQQAANEALEAAAAAKREVYGLSVTMTEAETKIRQNAEQIALRATKTEVANTLGGYYTKEETESAIKLESDSIQSTVSSIYTTKQENANTSEAASTAQNTADSAVASVATANSIIQQLADSIASLVRDGNGGSLIKQDSSGLYFFDIGEIEANISNTANSLNNLEGIVLDEDGRINVLESTAAALQQKTEYIRSYVDENDRPCLELGEGDSSFKVYITNESIQFADGTEIPASINRKMLVIEKTMIKGELQFGDDEADGITGVWVWKRRTNGNLGLIWKGVSS